jgi:hypothetical protein
MTLADNLAWILHQALKVMLFVESEGVWLPVRVQARNSARRVRAFFGAPSMGALLRVQVPP